MINIGTSDQKLEPHRLDEQHATVEPTDDKTARTQETSRDVIAAPREGAPVVVPKAEPPPTLAELAAARKRHPPAAPKQIEAPPTPTTTPPKPNLETKSRAFFAAYENSNPTAMTEMLAAKTVYEDPVFPHLEDQQVARMWKLIAGGGTKPKPEISQIKTTNQTTEIDWVANYKFLGASIANHIHTTLTFNEEGKITHQKDTFNWRSWGNQTPFPLNLLLRTNLGQKLIQWFLSRQLANQP